MQQKHHIINTLSNNGKLSFHAPDLAILLAEHTLSIFTRFERTPRGGYSDFYLRNKTF